MPIYEYQCTNCHHHFDLIQKISDEPVKQCPECHEDTVVKLISAAGFQLKGTGWYATDFKNKGSSSTDTSTKKEEPPKTADAGSASGSSD
ncbi:MAG: zinc ribbon domain-containing protein [Legionella sp.]|uniref:FmdB family zinc ribbon protein n=1 Tax=Legionella sp. TaxID=459 RepID=UPI0039E42362